MAKFTSDSRKILNRKPTVQFVEPPQVIEVKVSQPPTPQSVEEIKEKTQLVVQQYKRLEQLADLAQARIDARAKDVTICLHPTTDSTVVASLERQFGVSDSCITYNQYIQCLKKINDAGRSVTPSIDLNTAKPIDLFKKDFGGYGKANGSLRPELQPHSPIKAVDLKAFQKDIVKKLFNMMLPLLSGLTDFKIQQHVYQYPGHFK